MHDTVKKKTNNLAAGLGLPKRGETAARKRIRIITKETFKGRRIKGKSRE